MNLDDGVRSAASALMGLQSKSYTPQKKNSIGLVNWLQFVLETRSYIAASPTTAGLSERAYFPRTGFAVISARIKSDNGIRIEFFNTFEEAKAFASKKPSVTYPSWRIIANVETMALVDFNRLS